MKRLTCDKLDGMGWQAPGGLYADLGTHEVNIGNEVELSCPDEGPEDDFSDVVGIILDHGDKVDSLTEGAVLDIILTISQHTDPAAAFTAD